VPLFITNGGKPAQYPHTEAVLENGNPASRTNAPPPVPPFNIGTIASGMPPSPYLEAAPQAASEEAYFPPWPGKYLSAGRHLELVRFHKLTATVRIFKKKSEEKSCWAGKTSSQS
jgi:hypothetical protein